MKKSFKHLFYMVHFLFDFDYLLSLYSHSFFFAIPFLVSYDFFALLITNAGVLLSCPMTRYLALVVSCNGNLICYGLLTCMGGKWNDDASREKHTFVFLAGSGDNLFFSLIVILLFVVIKPGLLYGLLL